MRIGPGLVVACAFAAAPAFAQTPAVVNGTLESRAATQPVGREISEIISSASAPVWVGYSVPSIAAMARPVAGRLVTSPGARGSDH